jgi:hypothetical protein
MSGLKPTATPFQPSSKSWADDDDEEDGGSLSEQFAALSPKKEAREDESKGMCWM